MNAEASEKQRGFHAAMQQLREQEILTLEGNTEAYLDGFTDALLEFAQDNITFEDEEDHARVSVAFHDSGGLVLYGKEATCAPFADFCDYVDALISIREKIADQIIARPSRPKARR